MGKDRTFDKDRRFFSALEKQILEGISSCDPILKECPTPEEGVRRFAREMLYDSSVSAGLFPQRYLL